MSRRIHYAYIQVLLLSLMSTGRRNACVCPLVVVVNAGHEDHEFSNRMMIRDQGA